VSKLLLGLTFGLSLINFVSGQQTEFFIAKTDSIFKANSETIGLLIHVEAPDENISWSYAVGQKGKNNTDILLADQPVLMASNCKPYISATVLRLVEKKKLKLEQGINSLLSEKTKLKLEQGGYDLNTIMVKHLLSHTAGLRDYIDDGYFAIMTKNNKHHWTPESQIARSIALGGPLGKPSEIFQYGDINYVLLAEIIENITHKKFYNSVRELLKYKKNNLNNTWWYHLENQPQNTLPLVEQYWTSFQYNIPDMNPSWDLYGGGGMAANVSDMAKFMQLLFNGKIVKNKHVLAQMYQDVPPNLEANYTLGMSKIKVNGIIGYNHGGGLGTDATYFPSLNLTIVVASLEADKRTVGTDLRDLIIADFLKNRNKKN